MMFDLIQKKINKLKVIIGSLYSTNAETPTPVALIDNMLDKLPITVWSDPTLKWLDPVSGRGTFLLCIFERLMIGLTSIKGANERADHILSNMIYGCDINNIQYRHTLKTMLYLTDNKNIKLNLFNEDFLNRGWNDMKFDVIIGNPPFHENKNDGTRKAQSKSLYPQFIEKSFELVKQNGFVALITPTGWMAPYDHSKIKTKNGLNSGNFYKSIFRTNQLHYIEVGTMKKFFSKVGSSFSYFILQKKSVSSETIVKCQYNGSIFNTNIMITPKLEVFPLLLTPESISILNKLFDISDKIQLIDGNLLHSSPMSHKQIKIHKQKDKINNYPIWHTNSQILWSPIPHQYQYHHKILISKPGYFKPIYDSGVYGVADNSWMILVNNKNEGLILEKYLNSKLITFITQITKFSGFNTPRIIKQIPAVDLRKQWTDEKLYKHFKLTSEEIILVENMVK